MISPPQFLPGRTSRGAIQQRMPSFSSREHIALATVLSVFEWEMKTSCAIQVPKRRSARDRLSCWAH